MNFKSVINCQIYISSLSRLFVIFSTYYRNVIYLYCYEIQFFFVKKSLICWLPISLVTEHELRKFVVCCMHNDQVFGVKFYEMLV